MLTSAYWWVMVLGVETERRNRDLGTMYVKLIGDTQEMIVRFNTTKIVTWCSDWGRADELVDAGVLLRDADNSSTFGDCVYRLA
jgi:hypothetical protein